jgi:hypothetical protein
MIYALTLVAPVVLLGLLLVMERVEQPLRRDAVGERLVDFLDSARPEEVETFVSEGFAPALERYWSRRRSEAARRSRIEAAASASLRADVRRDVRRDVPVG